MDKQLIAKYLAEAQTKVCGAVEQTMYVIERIDAERGKEAVAWFAFADNNGPVPLELWGFDKKECKHAVLESARSVGWKGTIEGYLLHMRWAIRPLFLSSPTIPEGMALVPINEIHSVKVRGDFEVIIQVASCRAACEIKAMLAAAQGERNAD